MSDSGRIMHFPSPGPDYWSWRCLRCDAPVSAHASTLRLILAWLNR